MRNEKSKHGFLASALFASVALNRSHWREMSSTSSRSDLLSRVLLDGLDGKWTYSLDNGHANCSQLHESDCVCGFSIIGYKVLMDEPMAHWQVSH